MFVMTLLIIHLADGQSDVYQYAQKRQQPNVPLKYCEMEIDYPYTYDYPLKSRINANEMMGHFAGGGRFRRASQGVYDECCAKPCSMSELMSYCVVSIGLPGDEVDIESLLIHIICQTRCDHIDVVIMQGIDLMLLGIYALSNVTGPVTDKNSSWITPNRYNWEVDLNESKVSLADIYVNTENKEIPTKLRVTTWEDPPYSWTEGTEGNYTGHGYAFILFDSLLKNLNFTYEIVKPTTALFANEHDGIMKLLRNKEVDVAVAFLPILRNLRESCSYGSILSYTEITVLLKRPKVSAVGSGLLAPFDTTVWLCILVSLIIMGPVIYIFTSYRSYLFDNTKIDKYTFTACVWFTYGALLKQGSPNSPYHDSNRLLFATWWLFITLITSFYTANLTAFLTLSEFTLPIKSVKDIVDTKTQWTAQEQHIVDYAMKAGHAGTLEELKFSKARGYGKFFNISLENKETEIVDIVKNNEVFLGEKNLIDKIIHDDYVKKTNMNIEEKRRCTLVMMPQPVYRQNRAFAYQLNSPVQKLIDKQLLYLTEAGIIHHLETIKLPTIRYCPLNLQSKERQLSNDDLSLTYKVIASGFVIAILIFIIEMLQRWTKFKLCLCCEEACVCCRERMENERKRRFEIPSPQPEALFNIAMPQVAPIYESLVYDPKWAKKHIINGRDYWVIRGKDGYKRLVPIRSPSAMLFQYTS
ncbi:hypothetical protein PV326_009375 [Microctonus aethiopoides]|nr:hypothetical protein PV326_009375 [Microctonus aethiopoides]